MNIDPEQLTDLLGQGWASMNADPPAPSEEDLNKAYERDKTIHAAFSTGAGAEALQILRDMTIEQPCFNPQLGLVGALQGFSREGQNSMIRWIEQAMRRAEAGPPSKQQKK